MDKEIRLQSLDEIRQLLTEASTLWDSVDNTLDEVFYDPALDNATRYDRGMR